MTDHADSGEYGLHTNWENCEGGPCCDEALAIMEALVAERDEARRIVVQRDLELTATNCTLRYSREDLAAMKTRAEAAEAGRKECICRPPFYIGMCDDCSAPSATGGDS